MRALTLLVVAQVLAPDPGDRAAKDELKRLAGTWQVVPLDGAGADKDARAAAKRMKLRIEGDKYRVLVEGKTVEEGTLGVDPSKSPRTMDMKVTKGEGKGRVVECIYRLEKDTLLVCTALRNQLRPEKFQRGGRESALTKLVRQREKKD
jgi:uncharacterized protein (TIGR03067 family)